VRLRPTALLAAGAATLAVVALSPSTASAHASLERSVPAANAVLEESPSEVLLDFDEPVESSVAEIDVFDSGGNQVEVGDSQPGADSSQVHASLPTLDDGVYAVVWRVTSTDGHPVSGAFSFSVGVAGTGGDDLVAQVTAGGDDGGLGWWYGVARFLSIAGAVLLIGGGWWAFEASAERCPAVPRSCRVQSLLGVGAGLLLAGSIAAFGCFAARIGGGDTGDVLSSSAWSDALEVITGRMLLLRALLAVLLTVLLVVRLAGRGAGTWWALLALAGSVVTLLTFSQSGHPNVQEPRALWVAVDSLHLGAAMLWLGGAFVLVCAGRSVLTTDEGAALARRFSTIAGFAVGIVVATGVAQSLKLADGLDDLTATDWGRLLMTKIVLVVVVIAIAGVSRWLLLNDGAGSIMRTLVVEVVVGIAIVGLAAAMVGQPPRPVVAAEPFTATLTGNDVIAALTVTPSVVGENEVHIVVTPPGGSLTEVVGVTARVSLPAEIPASPVTLERLGPNHYSGVVTFPRAGEWTFEIVVQVTESETALLSTTVPVG
jgi:copper transport protein